MLKLRTNENNLRWSLLGMASKYTIEILDDKVKNPENSDSSSSSDDESLKVLKDKLSDIKPELKDQNLNMETGRCFVDPGYFFGKRCEEVEEFLKQFRRAAKVNGWNEQKCLSYLPTFLRGPALKWYDSCESTLENLTTFEELANKLRDAFVRVGHIEDLELRLQARVQAVDEPFESFVYDILNLCNRLDAKMNEASKVRYVLRGLRPDIVEKVMLFPNNTVEQLLGNLRNIEAGLYYAKNHERTQWVNSKQEQVPIRNLKEIQTPERELSSINTRIEDSLIEFNKQLKQLRGELDTMRLQAQPKSQFRTQGGNYKNNSTLTQYHRNQNNNFFRQTPSNSFPKITDRPQWTSDGRPICLKCKRPGHLIRDCKTSQQGN
ncbi:uncharacterized protein LOC134538775 [Bacillus rossius redtenbacheri]|uniref:uncharacterized protein LOC134538775 n=1 Tax=Bacillus rossius redtenbacheri TaxID=93214 RepID=UPI002FDCC7A0